MKPLGKLGAVALCFIGILGLNAQSINGVRFFKLNVQQLNTSRNLTNGALESFGTGSNEQNYFIDASMKFPIKLKGNLQIIGSLGYEREAVFGLYSPEEVNEGEDLNLHSAQTSLIVMQKLSHNRRITSRLAWVSNSNRFFSTDPKATAWAATVLYEKPIPNGKLGYGFAVGTCQRFSFSPLFMWQKGLGKNFGIDMFLPSHLLLTKQLNKSSRLIGGFKGQASSYFVEQQFQTFHNNNIYRRITVQALVGYERMINKLVGFETSLGVNIPYRSGIYTADGNQWETLHNFNDRLTPQMKAGIFLAIDRP